MRLRGATLHRMSGRRRRAAARGGPQRLCGWSHCGVLLLLLLLQQRRRRHLCRRWNGVRAASPIVLSCHALQSLIGQPQPSVDRIHLGGGAGAVRSVRVSQEGPE